MHILYLDDSGKVHVNDPGKVAVFAGFSVPVVQWQRLQRQINGAKATILPKRAGGNPNEWEIKSGDFLTLRAWQRAKNRNLCFELAAILNRCGCRVYSISLEKSKARDPLEEDKFVPMMVQRLMAKFYDQVATQGDFGTIVCDWSTHHMDQNISKCVSAMAVTQAMDKIIGGVTYGSSHALAPLQVADIIASTFRRDAEGEPHMQPLAEEFRKLAYVNALGRDMYGFQTTLHSIGKVF